MQTKIAPAPLMHTFYMFKSGYRPVEITARLYSENGSGTFFSGKGRTDAEAIGALICAAGASKLVLNLF